MSFISRGIDQYTSYSMSRYSSKPSVRKCLFLVCCYLGDDIITNPNPSDSFLTRIIFSLAEANSIWSDPLFVFLSASADRSEWSENLTKIHFKYIIQAYIRSYRLNLNLLLKYFRLVVGGIRHVEVLIWRFHFELRLTWNEWRQNGKDQLLRYCRLQLEYHPAAFPHSHTLHHLY